jgi:hypothetical protein
MRGGQPPSHETASAEVRNGSAGAAETAFSRPGNGREIRFLQMTDAPSLRVMLTGGARCQNKRHYSFERSFVWLR